MAELFSYDWPYEGESARFTVDLSHYGKSGEEKAALPCVLRLHCGLQKGGALGGRARRHIAALEKACEKAALCFAGRVECESRVILYYYAAAYEALESVEAAYAKERLLACRADVQEDAAWGFYEGFLYPDAAKTQTEENRKQIERIVKAGDNAQAARRIRLHMFFPSEMYASMFAQQARQSGFALGDTEFFPEMEYPYGLILIRVCTLEKPEVDALTTQALALAKAYEGRLVYWDCPIIPKASPLR